MAHEANKPGQGFAFGNEFSHAARAFATAWPLLDRHSLAGRLVTSQYHLSEAGRHPLFCRAKPNFMGSTASSPLCFSGLGNIMIAAVLLQALLKSRLAYMTDHDLVNHREECSHIYL